MTLSSPGRPGTGAGEATIRDRSATAVDLTALYREHRLPLARLALLLVDDMATAEDVVHDAFVALHQHQGRLRDPGAALGYLRTTVVNGSRSVLRRRQTVRKHLALVRDEGHADPADSELLLADGQQQVLAAVRRLPRRQQEVLALRYWGNLSEAEIADTLGISRGSVKSNASRGMAKLEAMLGAAT
ncbi:MAG TPA: SigE family RNA polymerase sigma factor [Jatrophihabitans sp.]|nr:SigE family RNA polymerase sigma factor [Jatrophihabitans sp.]